MSHTPDVMTDANFNEADLLAAVNLDGEIHDLPLGPVQHPLSKEDALDRIYKLVVNLAHGDKGSTYYNDIGFLVHSCPSDVCYFLEDISLVMASAGYPTKLELVPPKK